MSNQSINCPFCNFLISIEGGNLIGECPACHKGLHAPVKRQAANTSLSRNPSTELGLKKEDRKPSYNESPRMLGPYRIERNLGKGGMGLFMRLWILG
jgi:hypothetical protein